MQNEVDLKAIKEALPFGAISVIARKVGVQNSTVSRVLEGEVKSPRIAEIVKATAEYLKDYNATKKAAFDQLKEVLNS